MAKECVPSTGKLPMGGLPRNSAVRITDCPDMISAVDCGHKASTQPTNHHTFFIRKKWGVRGCTLYGHVIMMNLLFYIVSITITCPYNVYPLTPHFYIVKLGF